MGIQQHSRSPFTGPAVTLQHAGSGVKYFVISRVVQNGVKPDQCVGRMNKHAFSHARGALECDLFCTL
jgi:hypothetical protein